MSSDGSIIFGDLVGKLDYLHVECSKCERKGRYSLVLLIERYNANGRITDWLAKITADCPRKQSIDMSDQCGACCPDLPKVM